MPESFRNYAEKFLTVAESHWAPSSMILEVPKLQCGRNWENILGKASSLFLCLPADAAGTIGGSCWVGCLLAPNQRGQADVVASWQRSPPKTKMFLFLLMPWLNCHGKSSWLIWAMPALSRKWTAIFYQTKRQRAMSLRLMSEQCELLTGFEPSHFTWMTNLWGQGLPGKEQVMGTHPILSPAPITGRGRVTLGESFCIPVRGYSARN